jgi:hypothetical protein
MKKQIGLENREDGYVTWQREDVATNMLGKTNPRTGAKVWKKIGEIEYSTLKELQDKTKCYYATQTKDNADKVVKEQQEIIKKKKGN